MPHCCRGTWSVIYSICLPHGAAASQSRWVLPRRLARPLRRRSCSLVPCRQVNAKSHSDNRIGLLKIINLIQVLLFLGHVGFALLRSHLLSASSARWRNDSHLQVARPAPDLQGWKGNPLSHSLEYLTTWFSYRADLSIGPRYCGAAPGIESRYGPASGMGYRPLLYVDASRGGCLLPGPGLDLQRQVSMKMHTQVCLMHKRLNLLLFNLFQLSFDTCCHHMHPPPLQPTVLAGG